MLGNVPASPMPNSKRTSSSERNPVASPVAAVMADHQITIRVNISRGPKRSASHPLGTSKSAYAKVKALNTYPISASLSCKSALIAGAAVAMHTRSRYATAVSAKVKASTPWRTRVGVALLATKGTLCGKDIRNRFLASQCQHAQTPGRRVELEFQGTSSVLPCETWSELV